MVRTVCRVLDFIVDCKASYRRLHRSSLAVGGIPPRPRCQAAMMHMSSIVSDDGVSCTMTSQGQKSSRGYLVVYGGACHNESLAAVRQISL